MAGRVIQPCDPEKYHHVIRKNITRLDCTLGNGKNLVERLNDVFMTMHRLYHMADRVIQPCDPEKYHHVIRKNITRLDCTLGNGKNLVEMFE
jgi:hypothetical protein